MAIFNNSIFPRRSLNPHHPVFATERKIGVQFRNPNLLKTALTHSSYLNESSGTASECNERLEFLGDAVLDLAIAEALYKRHERDPITTYLSPLPEEDTSLKEGEMTLIRSKVVSGKTLARVSRDLGIGEHLLMGSGEEKSGGRDRDSNLAAAYEAVVGAISVDKGYDAARSFCIRTLTEEMNYAYSEVTSAPKQNANTKSANKSDQSKKVKKPVTAGKHPKSALQEISQSKHGKPPVYRITKATGKSNAMTFTAQVQVNGKTLGKGTGNSKKASETAAAKAALATLSDTD